MTSTTEQVQVLLDLAGISPSPSEIDQLEKQFTDMRARIEHLWTIDVGDAAPSMVLRAGEVTGPTGGADV